MKGIVRVSFVVLFLLILFSPKNSHAHQTTHVIEMTPNGFMPGEVTIDENTTLNFVNKDTTDRWPASDVHPTHDVFPEFDPKRPIAPGDVWLFTPKKVGTWKFHDHLLPHQRGVVTVALEDGESNTETTAKTVSSVLPSSNTSDNAKTTTSRPSLWQGVINFFRQIATHFFNGLGNALGVVPQASPASLAESTVNLKNLSASEQLEELKLYAKEEGSAAAWKLVRDTFKGEGGTSGNVHDVAHLSGQLLYAEKGFTGLSLCSVEFAFGCFHGFLDVAFKNDLSKLPEAEKACSALGPGVSGPVASCIHGIGHGVASFHQTSKLNESLTACDSLSEAARQYCYDGVFMEFERNAGDSFYTADDPLYPCNTLDTRFVHSCGRNQPQVLMLRFQKTFAEVAAICETAKNVDLKTACFDALGFIAASQGEGAPEKVVALCQQIPSADYFQKCVKAAAGEIVFQEMREWHVTSYQTCGALSEEAKKDCWGYIEHLMFEYGKVRPQTQGEDPNTYVQLMMRICSRLGGRDDCYKKIGEFLAQTYDLRDSLALLKKNEDIPEVYARCHEVTHYLSRAAYEKVKSVPKAYVQCDSTCHGGCYHGVLEAYMKEKQLSLGEAMQSEFASICGKMDDFVSPVIFYECMHGLGHAAMFITDLELPQALTLCDSIGFQEYRERCYSGVFMENSSSSTSTDHPGKYVRADDPMYPCNSLSEKYLQLCYRYQSSHFALITHHDWHQVSQLCLQVPDPYKHDCFRTVGTNQVGFTQDFSLMKANCEKVPGEFRDTCYAGVIGSLSYRFLGDMRKMSQFCGSLPEAHTPSCFRSIGAAIVDWSADLAKRNTWCGEIGNSTFSQWCKEGVNAS